MIATRQHSSAPHWSGKLSPTQSPNEAPLSARNIYALSEEYRHLVESPTEFRTVLRDRLARLQNTLPQLGAKHLRQARGDMMFIKAVLDNEGLDIAQIRAGAVYSADP